MHPSLVKLKISPNGDMLDYKLFIISIMVTLTFYHTSVDTQEVLWQFKITHFFLIQFFVRWYTVQNWNITGKFIHYL